MKIQNPSVTVSTVICQAMTFVTTANTTLAAAIGVCFVLMKTCITILVSFLINLANIMKGEPMRAIDADAITKRMIAFCNKNCPYTPKARDVMCGACFMRVAMELLEDAPTIEPERKTGRWIDAWRSKMDGTRYWYRECNNCCYERNDCDSEKDSNYCPNCGAAMIEEGAQEC